MTYFCRYKISNWSIFWRSISLYSSRWNAIAIAQVCYVRILESLVQNLHYLRSVIFLWQNPSYCYALMIWLTWKMIISYEMPS